MSKLCLCLISIFLAIGSNLQGQVLWSDDFSTGTNWSLSPSSSNAFVISTPTGDENVWIAQNLHISCFSCGDSVYHVSDISANILAEMNTNAIASVSANDYLSFYYMKSNSTPNLKIEISTNNGIGWSLLSNLNDTEVAGKLRWKKFTTSLALYAGSPVRFRFVYAFPGVAIPTKFACQIDDIAVESNNYQVYNTNQTIYVSSGTQMYLKDANYTNGTTATLNNNGLVTTNKDVFNLGSGVTSGTGKLQMIGTSPQVLANVSSLSKLEISNTSTSPRNIVYSNENLTISDSLVLSNGKLATSKDTRIILPNSGKLNNFSSSYVIGNFENQGTSANHSTGYKVFPIGNSIRVMPIALTDMVGTSPSITASLNLNPTLGYAGVDLESIGYNQTWRMEKTSGTLTNSKVILSANGAETTNSNEMFVSNSSTNDGAFQSLGRSSFVAGSPNLVISENVLTSFNSAPQFLKLGYAKNARLDFSLILQGAQYNTGTGLMLPYLNDNSFGQGFFLDTMYKSNLSPIPSDIVYNYSYKYSSSNIKMRSDFNVPANAIDVILVELRDDNVSTSVSAIIDTCFMWLMSDGTIKDFKTGSKFYCEFKKVDSGSYYVVIKHRNHLPIISANTVAIDNSSTAYIDLTDPNIVEAGSWSAFPYANGKIGMYLGNVYDDIGILDVNEVNANDLFFVSINQDNNIQGYNLYDVVLDGAVNADDYNDTQVANDYLYYSPVPYTTP